MLFVVAGASVFVWVITYAELPQKFTELFISLAQNRYIVLLLINVILFIVGMFIDTVSAIIIFTPLLLPAVQKFGIDEIHFGIIMMVNLAIGMCTPPFAVCLYVACGISKTKISDLLHDLSYMIPALVIVLLIITYFPETFMFLTRLIK